MRSALVLWRFGRPNTLERKLLNKKAHLKTNKSEAITMSAHSGSFVSRPAGVLLELSQRERVTIFKETGKELIYSAFKLSVENFHLK